jgi:PAS domain S-box-containing protein
MRAIDGRIAGTLGVSRDVTARKRAEEALQKSEERSHLLFATIPHPIWVYDPETLVFTEVNDAAIERYGYSREEFLQMKITDIRLPEENERLLKHLNTPRKARQSSGQWKHRTKDGNVIDVEVSSHIIDFFGRKAVLVVAQDISERKRLEVELRHAQKLEAVGGLAAGIAHEINTPIQFVGDNVRFLEEAFGTLSSLMLRYRQFREAVVAGKESLSLAEEAGKAEQAADLDWLTDEVPKAVAQTLDGVNRVATIVRAMKDFAHPDRNEKSATDLNKALESTLIVARNEVKYVADVETDFGSLPPVLCHSGDLNQVFLNLLVNAAHAIGDVVKGADKRGVIRVQTRREGDIVEVRISDSGSGIPVGIRDKVFEPFFTTKEVGRGTGQGLAIARSVVVDKHGGTLTFETEEGRGTTFIVRLPIAGSEADHERVALSL